MSQNVQTTLDINLRPSLVKAPTQLNFPTAPSKPVTQRHQMVSSSLAQILFIGLDVPLRSRAAALIGDKVQ